MVSHQNPVHVSPFPYPRYMPRPSHSSRFYHQHKKLPLSDLLITHPYTHTYTHTHVHIHTHTHIYTHPHTHTDIYTHTHTYTHTPIQTYIHTPTHTYTNTHTHTDIYTHTHVHNIYGLHILYCYIHNGGSNIPGGERASRFLCLIFSLSKRKTSVEKHSDCACSN
jgi:hypothetical protein